MKKVLALMAIVAVTFLSCSKDDSSNDDGGSGTTGGGLTVEKKNRALLIDFSEDWCPPCGSNGGPAFDSLLSYEGNSLNAIKVYTGSNNSSLDWSTGNGMWSIYNNSTYGGNGIPKFIAANQYQGVYSSWQSTVSGVLQKATAFNADSVLAGVALAKTIVGDSMKIATKVQFFKEQLAGTDMRLALYVVEETVVSSQSTNTGTSSNYEHKNIVRTSNSTGYAGEKINNSLAITADQVFENTYTVFLKPGWDKTKLKVVAAIWKMNSTPAKVINSNIAK